MNEKSKLEETITNAIRQEVANRMPIKSDKSAYSASFLAFLMIMGFVCGSALFFTIGFWIGEGYADKENRDNVQIKINEVKEMRDRDYSEFLKSVEKLNHIESYLDWNFKGFEPYK